MKKLLELYEQRLRNVCGLLGGIARVNSPKEQQKFYDLCVKKECFGLMVEDIKEMIVPEEADMTKELLTDIISWEKDLSEYASLESVLKEKYKINKRI